ncbi:Glycosyl transferases group 1 [Friedmanniella luteola]|uniref:Glycosyl transferases group 1 n=1 Tax=Friedmanniella luteola TaxID=546871 RepID=A0A1H1ZVK8_9ACTN|nr:glycosyltransferase [Friedmanniella luteola]SDT37286.1 Glycosyl transferases group 1 [Friedmanniella luteola]
MKFRQVRRRPEPEVVPPVADDQRAVQLADEIRRSGLFDTAWYLRHAGPLPAGEDPVDHYVRTGIPDDVSPQPCFDPAWYRSRPETPKQLDTAAFVHYVRRGAARGTSPHPLVDAHAYLADHPDAATHPGGPLGHYLESGWRTGARLAPGVDPEVFAPAADRPTSSTGAPFAEFAGDVQDLLAATAGHEDLARTAKTFDRAASDAFVAQTLAACSELREEPPLVSVVVPTKDRAPGVVEAVRSVLQQTYRHWQLVVVDDGSVDDTVEQLAPFLEDPRVELVRRPLPGGVSTARNAGLARAHGKYVAYLDSDNTWEPRFLEVMVAFVRTAGLRVGYAASELREEKKGGRTGFRALPFDREALQERNFIDCIVVLHERALLDEVGTFDETLRRNVDWDLFIRMAAVTDFGFAPFIGTRYDPWDERDDRITITEPFGYRHKVLDKHVVDWTAARARRGDRPPGDVSVVITANRSEPHLRSTIERVLALTAPEVEVVVVDAKLPDAEATQLQYLARRHPRLRVRRERFSLSTEVARNLGASLARGGVVVFVGPDVRVEPGWLGPLVGPLVEGAASACQPLVLRPDGAVWSAGTGHARGAHPYDLFAGFPGDAPEVLRASGRAALGARVLAVRADDFVGVGGFEATFVEDHDNADLSLRLAASAGREPRYVPQSLVSLLTVPDPPNGPRAQAVAAANQELYADRWRDVLDGDERAWEDAGYAVVGYETDLAHPARPVVVRDRSPRPLRWALKIGAPTVARRTNWGDWHFAVALKDALERRGQEVVIDCKDAWYRPTSRLDDVTLTLRGVTPYRPNPQHTNLVWVISHPQEVTARELRTFDAAFAASSTLAERLSRATGRTVPALLQCTDQRRFRPVAPDPLRRHEVLFVGNARGVRDSVGTALAAGIVPAVYGVRWQGLLPAGAWLGEYIPNEDLPAVYAGAGVVLNDHWDDMREHGLISNRLFDLAASGARIVSDPVPGLDEIFGDAVLTYETPAQLAQAVTQHLEEAPERRERRAAVTERIRREHTFDARAEALVETANRLSADLAGRRPLTVG